VIAGRLHGLGVYCLCKYVKDSEGIEDKDLIMNWLLQSI
jgi:hypothetical protein